MTSPHPCYVQMLCELLVDEARYEQRSYVRPGHVWDAVPKLIDRAHSNLDALWRNLSPHQRFVLYALSHTMLTDNASVTISTYRVTPGRILSLLSRYIRDIARPSVALLQEQNRQRNIYTIQDVCDELCRCHVLQRVPSGESGGEEPTYGWNLYLAALWTKQTKALSDINEGL